MTGLAIRTPQDIADLVKMLKGSGNLPKHIRSPYDLALCIATATDLGLPATSALRGMQVISGKVELSATLLRGLMKRAGYRIKWQAQAMPEQQQTLLIWDPETPRGEAPDHEETFTIEQADRAGLLRNETWRKYPEAMLRARCTSAAVRAYCPEVTMGEVYVEGEISVTQDVPPREAPKRPEVVIEESDTNEELVAALADAPAWVAAIPEIQTPEAFDAWVAEYAAQLAKLDDETRRMGFRMIVRAGARAARLDEEDVRNILNDTVQSAQRAKTEEE